MFTSQGRGYLLLLMRMKLHLLLLLLAMRIMLLMLLKAIGLIGCGVKVVIRGRVSRSTIRRVALVIVVSGMRNVLRVRRDRRHGRGRNRGTRVALCQCRCRMLLMLPAGHARRSLDRD